MKSLGSLLRNTFLILCFAGNVKAQFSQPGELDTTFNFGKPHSFFSNPNEPLPQFGPSSSMTKIRRVSQGKYLGIGLFTSFNGVTANHIVQFNDNGTIDQLFRSNIGTGFNRAPIDFEIQTDGKIVLVGPFTEFNNVNFNGIIRLMPSGLVDQSFQPGTAFTGIPNFFFEVSPTRIRIDGLGRIVVGGAFTNYNGTNRNGIVRILTNGTIDNSFNPGSGLDYNLGGVSSVNEIFIEPNKIILTGGFSSYNSLFQGGIIRLTNAGNLDTSFNVVGVLPSGVIKIKKSSTNKYILALRNGIAILSNNGSVDTVYSGFGSSYYFNGIVRDIEVDNQNRIYVVGAFNSYNGSPFMNFIRLNLQGVQDVAFNPISFSSEPAFNQVGVQNFSFSGTDTLLLLGQFKPNSGGQTNAGFALFSSSGNQISTLGFNKNYSPDGIIENILPLQDGRYLITGLFERIGLHSSRWRGIIKSDGQVDTTFKSDQSFSNYLGAAKIIELPNSEFLTVGWPTSTNVNTLYKLKSNGSVDTLFNIGNQGGQSITEVARYNSSSFLLAGQISGFGGFHLYNGDSVKGMTRINQNGIRDNTFSVGSGPGGNLFTNGIYKISVQSDGKIIVGGSFQTFNGLPRRSIARLNANGSVDNNFNPGSGFSDSLSTTSFSPEVYTIVLQTNGSLLVGGDFYSYNGSVSPCLVRLLPNGTIDATFSVGTGFRDSRFDYPFISEVIVETNGKILVLGNFDEYNGVSVRNICRLNTNGSLDTSFNISLSGFVQSMAVDNNGKLMLVGDFTSVNGIGRPYIARILGGNITGFQEEKISNPSTIIYPNPTHSTLQVKVSKPFTYTVHTIHGLLVAQGTSTEPEMVLNTAAYRSGAYLLRVVTDEGSTVQKFVKE